MNQIDLRIDGEEHVDQRAAYIPLRISRSNIK